MLRTCLAWLLGLSLLTGCGMLPVTDGFHGELPKPGTSTIVWGNDPGALGTATTWLQKRGLSVIERSSLILSPDPSHLELAHTLLDEAEILAAAGKAGADLVVFVDTSGDLRAPMVSIRGVEVSSRRVRWTGSARYTEFKTRPPKDTVANLTCHALATAWGFRPPGTKWFLSSEAVCNANEISRRSGE